VEKYKVRKFLILVILVVTALLNGCATKGSAEDTASDSQPATTTSESASSRENVPVSAKTPDAQGKTQTAGAQTDIKNVPNIVEPLRVVDSCKKEPYIKYEIQARASIKKGWDSTLAKKYGVGFRNAAEYKKWSTTHNIVYKKVSTACEDLSKCAKKYKKDRQKKCVQQAKRYSGWQKTAKSFAKKIKQVETQQPPKLCSIDPSVDDLSHCYEQIATNIDKVCDSEQCQEVSQCWRGIAYLDGAIRQSEQSCRFVHQKLKDCRAFTESTGRRKVEFKSCETLYGNLNIEVQPAL